MRRIYKKVGEVTIYGSNRPIMLEWSVPEWNKHDPNPDVEACFRYQGNRIYLSEIMMVHNPLFHPNPAEWMDEFDGYADDSFFSGILIKFGDKDGNYEDECVRAFTYATKG